MDKKLDFKIRRDHGKSSYEDRVYESVDDGIYLKNRQKQNSCNKGLKYILNRTDLYHNYVRNFKNDCIEKLYWFQELNINK